MRRGGERMSVREVPNHVKGDAYLMERNSSRENSEPKETPTVARKKNQYFKLINNATPTAPRGTKPQERGKHTSPSERKGGRDRERERKGNREGIKSNTE